MAKKNKNKIRETTIEDYYDLKSDEMDELVAALKGEIDESVYTPLTYDIKELTGEAPKDKQGKVIKSKKGKKFNPYSIDGLSSVPTWVKACFVKWWAFGAVCYFVMFGFGNLYVTDTLDLAVLTGVVVGLITDLFINSGFSHFQSDEREYDNFMMFPFPFKKYWTFIPNLAYGVVVMLGVNGIYYLINENITTTAVEPLLFATFYLIIDMILIGIKDLIVYLVRRHKKEKLENIENA